ncbi:MAG TPA: D-alanine--D-alanine ligase family protein [Candidatus Limnocylindrales bacterium]|nr:D-alanine--D-alanine ligase family protein [Candidatus Limnocylindrales bacterium]
MPVPPIAHEPASTPVAVVLGGPSAEHDVSIVSGTAIGEALMDAGYPVSSWYVDLDGGWWWLPDGHRRDGRPQAGYDDPGALGATGPVLPGEALAAIASQEPRPVVFIALHGPFGEDGTVQALCETAGLAYTGSGVTASAVGMDKAIFKRLVRGLGLPVVDWREVHAARWARDRDAVLAELEAFAAAGGDERLMVKPARLGSSVGMTLAHDADERAAALEEAFRFDDLALVERYLAGARDIEVAVIGNEPDRLELYGPGEIASGHEFYDYTAKYSPGVSRTTTAADLPPARAEQIRKLARDAYRACGCEGFARVDFLLAGDQLVVSEINTIPGFTPISLFPTMPAAAGYDFAAVCRRVVDLALERAAARVRHRLSAADLPR